MNDFLTTDGGEYLYEQPSCTNHRDTPTEVRMVFDGTGLPQEERCKVLWAVPRTGYIRTYFNCKLSSRYLSKSTGFSYGAFGIISTPSSALDC